MLFLAAYVEKYSILPCGNVEQTQTRALDFSSISFLKNANTIAGLCVRRNTSFRVTFSLTVFYIRCFIVYSSSTVLLAL